VIEVSQVCRVTDVSKVSQASKESHVTEVGIELTTKFKFRPGPL